MTDHELCLAAARAAGYTVESYDADWVKLTGKDGLTEYWNPLEYDEDVFRLMVDCEVEARFCDDVVTCRVYGKNIEVTERAGTDKHAATRRAIVRAAAAIGVGG